ncbi:MAG TPA: sucrose phosphorylase [Actinomycetaceae bacterium]|nr:sucrose phosphorylase [Actinomycetaceae bacterium]
MPSNRVQLITYADRLAGDLPGLARMLASPPWNRAFGGVHILPFYTPFDGADAGFDPTDHTAVDPRLGSWDDIAALRAAGFDVMADLIVNHVSSDSAEFRDVVERGSDSPFSGMFLTLSSIFPDGATEAELARIYRPRPGLPFTPVTWAGEKRLVWTTFTPQQIDVNVASPAGRAYLGSVLAAVAGAGVNQVRLDAVGYAVKTPGTTCFMTSQTFEFIDEFAERARGYGVEVLVEVHSYYRRQVEIAEKVDRVYDFALPPLVLHALTTTDFSSLAHWLEIRPGNAVTVLDTHDGIGIVDVGADPDAPPGEGPGLIPPEQLDALVERIHENSGGTSRLATGAAASNLDLYQVNCTYFDALGADEGRYLAARAIQFFTPGLPHVYYVGALAGSNDVELLRRTGVGRDINRKYYAPEDVAAALERPVVRALFALAAFRNEAGVFDGEFDSTARGGGLTMSWRADGHHATLDVGADHARLEWDLPSGSGATGNLLDEPPVLA